MVNKSKLLLPLLLSLTSIFCVGYAGWTLGDNSVSTSISASVGDVIEGKYKEAIFYVKGSEEGFDYYVLNNEYFYTDTTFSIKLVIYPTSLYNICKDTEVDITFGIQYEMGSTFNYLFFEDNDMQQPPSFYRCQLSDYNNYYINSEELSYSKESVNNGQLNRFTLSANIKLYSEYSPSIYSLTSYFRKDTEDSYIFLDIVFPFVLKDGINKGILNATNFNIITNLKGVSI